VRRFDIPIKARCNAHLAENLIAIKLPVDFRVQRALLIDCRYGQPMTKLPFLASGSFVFRTENNVALRGGRPAHGLALLSECEREREPRRYLPTAA
jgi:hypothetical protein